MTRRPYLGSVAAMISVYLDLAARQQLCQVYAHHLLNVLSPQDLQWAAIDKQKEDPTWFRWKMPTHFFIHCFMTLWDIGPKLVLHKAGHNELISPGAERAQAHS